MVEVAELPEQLLISSAIADTELVVGQTARVKILEGDQLAPSRIGVDIDTAGINGVVTRGYRGYSIGVQEVTAVGGLLLPGNRVDVYMSVYWDWETPDPRDDVVVQRVILEDIEVLSVGQEAQETGPSQAEADAAGAAATSGNLPDDVSEQPDAQTVTLSLTPEQVGILACAQGHDQAQMTLALRGFGEPAPESRTAFNPCGGIVQ
jgi:pilus assembly protein CpaB